MQKYVLALLLVLLLSLSSLSFAQTGGTGAVTAPEGMVSTSNRYASLAGVEVLRQGGNAVDAMAVIQFVLTVTEPYASGIGGGAFIMIYDAESGEVVAIDGREEAPAGYTPEVFLDDEGNPIGFVDRATGGNAVGVPGTLAAMARALEAYGTLTLAEALQPAIELARDGFVIDDYFSQSALGGFNAGRIVGRFPATEALYYPDGEPLPPGSIITNPDLADTLELIAEEGISAFYEGEIAADIVDAVQNAPFNPGVMTLEDLAGYRAVYREPVTTNYRGYDVYGMNMPTSGGTTLMMMLNLLEAFDLGSMAHGSLDYLTVMSNAQNIAFADRNAYMADADFVDVNVAGLIDEGYARQRRAMMYPQGVAVSVPVAPGTPPVIEQDDEEASAWPYSLVGHADTESVSTTHFSVIDADRNMVSVTSTIELLMGSGVLVPGRGFLLNNELTDFSALPEDAEGNPIANAPTGERAERRTALGDDAETIGGKRPRSSMAPTLVLRDGEPFMALGSPGGSRIIGYNLNVLTNVIDFGMDVQTAVNAPRVVARNGTVTLDDAWATAEILGGLEARGFAARGGNTGSVQAIVVGEDELLYGAADPRRNGLAIGH